MFVLYNKSSIIIHVFESVISQVYKVANSVEWSETKFLGTYKIICFKISIQLHMYDLLKNGTRW